MIWTIGLNSLVFDMLEIYVVAFPHDQAIKNKNVPIRAKIS